MRVWQVLHHSEVSLPEGESEEDNSEEAVGAQGGGHGISKFTGAGFLVIGIAFLGIAHLVDPNLFLHERGQSAPKSNNPLYKTMTSAHPATAAELLHSRALKQVAEDFAVNAVEANLKLSNVSNPRLELPATWREDVRSQARNHYELSVRKLVDVSPGSLTHMQNRHINPEQADAVVSALHALSDPRLLDVGLQVGSACKTRTLKALEICALELLAPRAAEIRQLREKLLPAALHSQNKRLKALHLNGLRRSGFFAASTKLGSWNAEFAVSPNRLLQSGEISPALRGYFGTGAPIVSVAVGALFQILMAVLPGDEGMPTNRDAEYAMFGLEAGAVLTECLLNIKRQVVLYASCGLDILFLATDVVFVFFDGQLGVTAPRRVTNCASYTVWNNLTGVCGNCMGTTTSQLGGVDGIDTCNNWCSSFGHGCRYAASAVDGSCFPRGRYKCEERMPLGARMLCQCFTGRLLEAEANETNGDANETRETEPTSAPQSLQEFTAANTINQTTVAVITPRPGIESIQCGGYPIWPNINGAACGNCQALVPGPCDSYCQSFDHTCFAAAFPDGNTCMENRTARCSDDPGPQGRMLCSCGLVSGQEAPPSRCDDYPQWLSIESSVCGNCTAVVRLNVPARPFSNCNSFCQTFGHVCERAALGSTKGDTPCLQGEPLNCTTAVSGIKEALCTCVRP